MGEAKRKLAAVPKEDGQVLTREKIQAKIAEIEKARDSFLTQANAYMARTQGSIDTLKELLASLPES